MIKIMLLTLAVVLVCTIEVKATDWQLTIFDHEKNIFICAKDEASCRLTQEAIRNNTYQICDRMSSKGECDPSFVLNSTETICEPHLNCFSERSNCIKRFNC